MTKSNKLQEMMVEIQMYHEMIQNETMILAYTADTYDEYVKRVNRIEEMVTEFIVLLDMFVIEVEEQKTRSDSNVVDLDVERYYRMAKETLKGAFLP